MENNIRHKVYINIYLSDKSNTKSQKCWCYEFDLTLSVKLSHGDLLNVPDELFGDFGILFKVESVWWNLDNKEYDVEVTLASLWLEPYGDIVWSQKSLQEWEDEVARFEECFKKFNIKNITEDNG